MDIEQMTEDEKARAKFRKSCAELGKAVAKEMKPFVKGLNDLLLRFESKPYRSWLRRLWRWVLRLLRCDNE